MSFFGILGVFWGFLLGNLVSLVVLLFLVLTDKFDRVFVHRERGGIGIR